MGIYSSFRLEWDNRAGKIIIFASSPTARRLVGDRLKNFQQLNSAKKVQDFGLLQLRC